MLLIGLLQTVPLTVDKSLVDAAARVGWQVAPDSLAYPLMKLTLAQVASNPEALALLDFALSDGYEELVRELEGTAPA